jgi:uncharacterized protein
MLDSIVSKVVLWCAMVLVLPAFAASFDCAKAAMPTEKAICKSEDLSKMDEQMALLFKRQLAASADKNWQQYLKTEQKNWLKDRNAQCKQDVACLKRDYELRNQFYLSQPALKHTGRYVQGSCPKDGRFMDVTVTRDATLDMQLYVCPDSQGNTLLQASGMPDNKGVWQFKEAGCQFKLTFKGAGLAVLENTDKKCNDLAGRFQRDPKRSPYLIEE